MINKNIGKKFNNLTVVSVNYGKISGEKTNRLLAACLCDCGKSAIFPLTRILSNHVKSCGCRKNKHGMKGTRFYNIWIGMKHRASGAGVYRLTVYGQLGLSEDWKDFINFKNDMYESYLSHIKMNGEKDTTLDRIDGKLGYSKENCRWATYRVQAGNISTNRNITIDGVTDTITEFARKYGIKKSTASQRVRLGWSDRQIVGLESPPPRNRGGKVGRPKKMLKSDLSECS